MVFEDGNADDFFFNDNCLLQDDLDMTVKMQRRLTYSAAKAN